MTAKRLLLSCLLWLPAFSFAQNVSINADGSAADASAILDIKASTKGLLVPRMLLSEKTAIVLPAKGLLIYQTNGVEGFYYNSGTAEVPDWILLGNASPLSGGTANYLIKWTGANTVANSLLRDNGTEMSINSSPLAGTSLLVQNNDASGIGIKTVNLVNGTAFYSQAGGSGIAATIHHTGTSGTALNVLSAGAYAATFMGGRVGIGTVTPATELQLSATSPGSGPTQSFVAASDGSSAITMGSLLSNNLGRIAYDNSSNRMGFSVNGIQQLELTVVGLAIGPSFSTPKNLVHLNGGDDPAFVQVSNDATGTSTTDGMHFGLGSNGEGYISYLEPHDFKIQTNTKNAFWMNSDGKVGIYGPPDTAYSVLLYNRAQHPGLALNTTGVTVGDIADSAFSSYISIPFETNSNIMLMGGNVGIGMSPTQKLEIDGNVQVPVSGEYKYAAAKLHYYSVPAIVFQPETTGSFEKGNSNGSIYASGGTPAAIGYFTAPVNLPDGATVTCVTFYEVDNDGTYNLQSGQLCRNDASTLTSYGNSTVCATVTAPAGSHTDIKAVTTSSITNPTIDNQNYTYYLRWGTQQDNPDMRLAKVLITYTVTKAD